MTFKDFIEMYDNWNSYVNINDNNLKAIYYGKVSELYENKHMMSIISNKMVVAFGIYDGLLTIRIDTKKGEQNV